MKKLALILAVLLALSLTSCSGDSPDTPDTPEDTTNAHETVKVTESTKLSLPEDSSAEELIYLTLEGALSYDELLEYPSAEELITRTLHHAVGYEVTPNMLNFYLSDTPDDEEFPYTVLINAPDRYQTFITVGLSSNGFKHTEPLALYGRYTLGDTVIPLTDGNAVNKSELLLSLAGSIEVNEYTFDYSGISVSDGVISIPMYGSTTCFAKLQVNGDLSYSFLNIEEFSRTAPPEEEHDKLFELFSLNAGQIREKYGEITTDFYAYGGTPVCSLKDYAGVLCFFFDGSLDTPITDDLTPDWIALVSSYPYTFHGIEIGKSIDELSTDLTWKTAEYHVLGSHCLVSELDGYEIRVHLDITGYDLPALDEENATEDEYSEWENNLAKSPCGTVLGIRINKIK